jgi:hypothetical protein
VTIRREKGIRIRERCTFRRAIIFPVRGAWKDQFLAQLPFSVSLTRENGDFSESSAIEGIPPPSSKSIVRHFFYRESPPWKDTFDCYFPGQGTYHTLMHLSPPTDLGSLFDSHFFTRKKVALH